MNHTDYKQIYSENMNDLFWDSTVYDVHHIDFNRSNNNFENLVLLPKKLHHKFHFFYTGIKNESFENLSDLNSQSHYTLERLSDFFNTKNEVLEMLDLKNQLLMFNSVSKNDDFDLILSATNPELYSKYVRGN